MKKYYAERNGPINGQWTINFDKLLELFKQTYDYFKNRGCFEVAYKGVTENVYNVQKLIIPPTMAPSPQVFFEMNLQKNDIWPIHEFYEGYDEDILFTIIEILYDHISVYDYGNKILNTNEIQEEYASIINNILRAYKNGYYLVPSTGFIMEQPNQALKEQLEYNGEDLPKDIFENLISASQNYYRYDSD